MMGRYNNVQGFSETRHVLWWKGHSALTLDGFLGCKPPPSRSRFQTECFALAPSYEGIAVMTKATQNGLKYPRGQKNTPEMSLIESLCCINA